MIMPSLCIILHLWFVTLHVVQAQYLSFRSQAILSDDKLTVSDLPPSVTLKTRPTVVYRPSSLDALHHARLRSLHEQQSEIVEWDRLEIPGPDVEDLHTLAQLARMAGNAYALFGQSNWYDVDPAWNRVSLSTVTFLHHAHRPPEFPFRLGAPRRFPRACVSVV